MTIIQDGTGKGTSALVNEQNELLVKAIVVSAEAIVASRDGQAYFANTTDTADTLTLATGNTYNLLYLSNKSATKELVIQRLIVSSDTAGVVLTYIRNPVLGTVSANNIHEPVNNNFSSGNKANALCHNWDETGTVGIGGLTGGTIIEATILPVGATEIRIDGSLVLEQGNSILIHIDNNTGGDAEVECGIRFYFDNPEV